MTRWSLFLQTLSLLLHHFLGLYFLRDAYYSLCVDLAARGYAQQCPPTEPGGPVPQLEAILISALGPLKSASAVMPHVAHLLGKGILQRVSSVEQVTGELKRPNHTQVVLFADDFAGTGEQIASALIDSLAADPALKEICHHRLQDGYPLAVGVLLAVAFESAVTRILLSAPAWLPIFVCAGEVLDDSDQAFSDRSSIFQEAWLREQSKSLVVDTIGRSLWPDAPGGFGDMQALVVTADNVPDTTLPAIWRSGMVNGTSWRALFERSSSPGL